MAKEHEGTWSGDSALGRRIWGRYATSPGLISTGDALRLAGRVMRAARLPLLADVQRRWTSLGETWPRGGSALLYVQPAPAVPASPRSAEARGIAPAVGSAGQAVQREIARGVESLGLPAADGLGQAIVQRHQDPPTGLAARPRVSDPEVAGRLEPIGSSSRPAGGRGSTAVQRELAVAGVRHSQEAPIRRVSRMQMADSAGLSGRPLVEPRSQPVLGKAGLSSSEGGLEAAIVQRYRETPIKRVSRTPFAAAETAGLSGPVELVSEANAQLQKASAGSGDGVPGRPLVKPSPGPADGPGSPASFSGDLEAALVQRREGTPTKPASQATIPATGAAGVSGPLELASRAGSRMQSAGAKPGSDAYARPPAVPSPPSAGEPRAAQPAAAGGDLGAEIVQRVTSSVAGNRLAAQADPLKASGAGSDLGTTILQRHLDGLAGWAREGQRPPPSPAQLPSTRKAESSATGAIPFGQRAAGASGRVEMPLARAAVDARGTGGGSLPDRVRPAVSDARLVSVQRAADTAAAPGAGAPASVPASSSAAPSGAEGPNLERLADEVYAIIERRLIIERESRGL